MAMHELRISVDVRPGAAVVSVVGDVSAVNIDPFRKGLADAIARKQPRTVVDLSQTTFLSSPGLAVLVQGLQLSQRGGSQLYLAAANDRVRGIFEIARLTDHFLATTTAIRGRRREVLPQVVLEIAFDAIQASPRHDSGLALRFPRIVRLRPDKTPAEIDTLAHCRRLTEVRFAPEERNAVEPAVSPPQPQPMTAASPRVCEA